MATQLIAVAKACCSCFPKKWARGRSLKCICQQTPLTGRPPNWWKCAGAGPYPWTPAIICTSSAPGSCSSFPPSLYELSQRPPHQRRFNRFCRFLLFLFHSKTHRMRAPNKTPTSKPAELVARVNSRLVITPPLCAVERPRLAHTATPAALHRTSGSVALT